MWKRIPCILFLLVLFFQEIISRSVHVNLTASWPSSRAYPVLETSEFLAEQDNSYFWKFIESFAEVNDHLSIEDASVNSLIEISIVHASKVVADDIEKLLRLVLAVRSYSASIEMYRQLALDSLSRNIICPSNTDTWAIVYMLEGCVDQVICSTTELDVFLEKGLIKLDNETCIAAGKNDFELYFDHVHPSSPYNESGIPSVVLYGTIGTQSFHDFHRKLIKKSGELRYIVRHHPIFCDEPTVLQGYGVALDIKNMEYKTIDDSRLEYSENDEGLEEDDDGEKHEDVDGFLFSTLIARKPQLASELKEFRDSLVQREKSDDLKAWDLKDLGYSAMNDIIKSKDPLKRLQQLSENFPKYAHVLAFAPKTVSQKVRKEVDNNRKIIVQHSLINKILLNGLVIDPSKPSFNVFSLLKELRSEYHLNSQINSIGLSPEQMNKVTKLLPKISDSLKSPPRIQTLDHKDKQIFYLNDIETDISTSRWSSGVEAIEEDSKNLLMIRKNMHNILIFLDPTTLDGIQALTYANFFIRRVAPIRLAVVITSKTFIDSFERQQEMLENKEINIKDKASAMQIAKLLDVANEKHGQEVAAEFILSFAGQDLGLNIETLVSLYAEAVGGTFSYRKAKKQAMEVLQSDLGNERAIGMAKFAKDKGLTVGCYLFNGRLSYGGNLQEDLMLRILQDQQIYSQLAKEDILTDENNWFQHLLKRVEASPSFVSTMANEKRKYLKLTKQEAFDSLHLTYLYKSEKSVRKSLIVETLTLFVDLKDKSAIEVVKNALLTLRDHETLFRLCILPLPVSRYQFKKENELPYEMAIIIALKKLQEIKEENRIDFLLNIFLEGDKKIILEKIIKDFKIKPESIEEESSSAISWTYSIEQTFGLKKRQSFILLNNQQIELEIFSSSVLEFMISYDYKTVGKHVEDILTENSDKIPTKELEKIENIAMQLASILSAFSNSLRLEIPKKLNLKHSQFVVKGAAKGLEVTVFLDPLTEVAQRLISLLYMLHDNLDISLKIILIPSADYGEFPLKRFYRFLFNSNSSSVVKFDGLPIKPILTMKLETLESWNIQLLHSIADLDNLRVDADNRAEVKGTKYAEFQLKNLLVAGQCDDITSTTSPPPNGLQLILEKGKGNEKVFKDTLVMQNLGYFQLQATPGIWKLKLAKGKARNVYEIVNNEGTKGEQKEEKRKQDMRVIVNSFSSPILQLQVRKRSGMEQAQLLDDVLEELPEEDESMDAIESSVPAPTSSSPSLWKSMTTYFDEKRGIKPKSSSVNETIHVFSVASGHLYERFLKIMMLTVSKTSNNPIKFWLLENFLSPSFKASIPYLTQAFGFEVELVTYKWPFWLRQQTEKQRIIWGYKILFLDVLFPLDVKKIIYVDADQIVRADLKELWEMDLQGKAYAYTPFCSSRKETLGFQFWRSGYWKNHLSGNPYHISALYVVDLVQFRKTTAGDILRAIYDNLSRDPNSLSNLDQDLPNYAQHQIPIFSLPQEWLWCESWCSDESKSSAKTIDLCNNPLHKEPKLEMAKRIISGKLFSEDWLELDQQIKAAEASSLVNTTVYASNI